MSNARTVRGECLCGKVRFECLLPTKFVAHCHCHNCRRAHGAAFVTWAGFLDPQLSVVAGTDDLVRSTTETKATRSFCRTCGTTLFYAGPRWPGEAHVAVANILDPLDRMPQVHAYADRAPEWCPITDRLPRFGGETGTEPLQEGDRRCYLLVLLKPGRRFGEEGFGEAHEAFITRLIQENRILLGGRLEPGEPSWGGYLLACSSAEEGRALAAQDPYILEGLFEPTYQEWDLVGINPAAIDSRLVLQPGVGG